jgi:predicted metal-dependent peptidase
MKFDKIHGEFEDDFFMDTKESGSEYNLVKKFTLVMRDFAARYDSENSNTSMGGDPFLYQVLYPMYSNIIPMSWEKDKYPHAGDTAATNGIETFWNPYYCNTMSLTGLRILITHEALHVIYLHPRRLGSRHPFLWNLMVDFCVNSIIVSDIDNRLEKRLHITKLGNSGLDIYRKHKGDFLTYNEYKSWIKDPFSKENKKPLTGKSVFETYVNQDPLKEKLEKEKFNSLPSVKEKVEYIKEKYSDALSYCDKFEKNVKPEEIYNECIKVMHVCPSCKGLALYKLPEFIIDELLEIRKNQYTENAFNRKFLQGILISRYIELNHLKMILIIKNDNSDGFNDDFFNAVKAAPDSIDAIIDTFSGQLKNIDLSSYNKAVNSFNKPFADLMDDIRSVMVDIAELKKQKDIYILSEEDAKKAYCDECNKGEWYIQHLISSNNEDELSIVYDFVIPKYIDLFFFNQKGGHGGHLPSKADEQELARRLSEAAQAATQQAGNVPGGLTEELGLLTESKIRWQDQIRITCQHKKEGKARNNWSYFKTRPMFGGMLIPRRFEPAVNIGVCVDSSGSMSSEEIAYGISQLQNINSIKQGFITFADGEVYWENTTKLDKFDKESLQRLKVEGRGGTDFVEKYVLNCTEKLKSDLDVIIFVTDGEFFTPPEVLSSLKVKPQVFWLITKQHGFKPPFGKAFHLYNEILT